MRTRLVLVPVISAAVVLVDATHEPPPPAVEYTNDFGLEHCGVLVPDGGNRYFSLEPGRFVRLEGRDHEEGYVVSETTVLDVIRPILFTVKGQRKLALTRAVEEREWIDGALSEVSLSYYARCPDSGNVYCLGQDVARYRQGQLENRDGSWIAGRNGAKPGLAMPDLFLLGARYCREFAPGVSVEQAEQTGMGLTVETPAGVFADCVSIMETSAADDDGEDDEETIKVYASGIGLIVDGPLTAVELR